jgi:nucleoside-diphosphate-sugar epimerase
VPSRADGVLNLLHYSDAAAAAVAALRAGATARGAAYIACHGVPVTHEPMMRAALATGLFPDGAMPRFRGDAAAPRGRRMRCAAMHAALGWVLRSMRLLRRFAPLARRSERVLRACVCVCV